MSMKEGAEKRVIKRYRNRKLYDTTDSCYVTLEDIADLVRSGEEVSVIDNPSQDDLTSVTLAQIILEEERRKKESLPLGTLTHLIRSGGEVIRGIVQTSLGDGVKEISHVKDEIYNHLEGLVRRGSISRDEGYKLLATIRKFIESKVKPTIENVQNLPTVQSEVRYLKKKLEDLEKKLSTRPPLRKR